jgi:hypothetical protein
MSLNPKVRVNNILDNPLLPRKGVPITRDDFVDYSERVLNSTGSNLLYTDTNDMERTGQPIYYMDPSKFYNEELTKDKQYDLGRFKIEHDHSIPTPSVSDNLLPYQIYADNGLIEDGNQLDRQQVPNYININNQNETIVQQSSGQQNNEDNNFTNYINIHSRILNDILNNTVSVKTFTDNNGLFYIGVTIIIIALIFLFIMFLTNMKKPDREIYFMDSENKITKIAI